MNSIDKNQLQRAGKVPLVTSTFTPFRSTEEMIAFKSRERDGELSYFEHEYGRYSSPTVNALEENLTDLDRAESSLVFSSGMSAVTTTLLALVNREPKRPDIIISANLYSKTAEFITSLLPSYKLRVRFVTHAGLSESENLISSETQLVFLEVPANPILRVQDVRRLSERTKKHGATLIIDSSFAPPPNYYPLEIGADLNISSLTKYIGGHNDLLAGSVSGSKELIDTIRKVRGILGTICAPDVAIKVFRGIETLKVRVNEQNRIGELVARYLETHPKIKKVWYPGLPSHPDYPIAKRDMKGFGGVVPFEVGEQGRDASRFIDALKIPLIAPSFGGNEPLISQPSIISYLFATQVHKKALGIKDSLVRLVVGLAEPDKLIDDIEGALRGI